MKQLDFFETETEAKAKPFKYRSVGAIYYKNMSINEKINLHSHNENSFVADTMAGVQIKEWFYEDTFFFQPKPAEKINRSKTETPPKEMSKKDRKEAERIFIEVGMKLIRQDFLKQWARLS